MPRIRKLYTDLGIIDTYDAAVLTRKAGGRLRLLSAGRSRPVRVQRGDLSSGWRSGGRQLPYSPVLASGWLSDCLRAPLAELSTVLSRGMCPGA